MTNLIYPKHNRTGMKIFLDAGSNGGLIPNEFKKEGIINDTFKVVSFEPNKKFRGLYPHEEVAVWVEDGWIEFGTGVNDFRSTIVEENINFIQPEKGESYKVKTIDFSKWLSENIREDDYVVLKMDIEGAEFGVLEKMIADGAHLLVNQYYVEFHEKFFDVSQEEEYYARRETIIESIPNLIEWR